MKREDLRNLLCVKSIITIVIVVSLAVLAVLYPEEYADTLQQLSLIVVTFYFSHQTNKWDNTQKKEGDNHERH